MPDRTDEITNRPRAPTDGGSRFNQFVATRPLVLDAAMGTRLIALGLDLKNDDPAFWNLDRPASVQAIHERDRDAGANAFLTNTFGANRHWLCRYGQAGEFELINRRASALARAAAGRQRFVVGDIGPTAAEDVGAAAVQAAILFDCGVDALILETFLAADAQTALAEVRGAVPDWFPIIVSLREWPKGNRGEIVAQRLNDAGASILGINCRPDIDEIMQFARSISRVVDLPLLVRPSGSPSITARGEVPGYLDAVPALLDQNVRLLGGCCGTTESVVRSLSATLDSVAALVSPDSQGALR
jgi:methionine synthase I (cobalamin-dependent)